MKEYSENCRCNTCEEYRNIKSIIESKEVDKLIKIIYDLYDKYINADFDVAYYKCVFNGSWPQGKEILERALEKYKDKKCDLVSE